MSTATIIGMLGVGVAATVGEKVLNAFGKADMASFCNIAGLVGLGMTAIGLIGKLVEALSTL